jgi:L-2-hydroxyglutarate oxidase
MDLGTYDYVVVGAGIVGAATAVRLWELMPKANILLIDKEDAPARHQTGRNSGVVHTGAYYRPGSKKVELCREGLLRTKHFCRQKDLKYETRGKLLVATNDQEKARLGDLGDRAIQNGVAVENLSLADLNAHEPNVSGCAAIRLPEAAIVDYVQITRKLLEQFVVGGGTFLPSTTLTGLNNGYEFTELKTDRGSVLCDHLIVCGGLQSDRIIQMAGLASDVRVVPFRGEYYRLPVDKSNLVRHLIYPVPDPSLPFLGIHLTPMVDGSVTVGPNAIVSLAREGYSKVAFDLKDCREMALFPGFWRSLAKHPGAIAMEVRSAISKRYYLKQVRKYCPKVELRDLGQYVAGHRAQIVHLDGRLEDDFVFRSQDQMTFVLNAPSPAATSAIPIAHEICKYVLSR